MRYSVGNTGTVIDDIDFHTYLYVYKNIKAYNMHVQ